MRTALRRLWEWAVSKSGPLVAVLFVLGDDPRAVAMADEIGRSRPQTPRLIVSWRPLDEGRFREAREFIVLDSQQPWSSLIRFRLNLLRRRVGTAVVQLSPDASLAYRCAAIGAWPLLIVYNTDGESCAIGWRHPIASWRFLRGVPAADIGRPTRFAFFGEWLMWARVAVLLADWGLRRRHGANPGLQAPAADSDGCAVLCVPGAKARDFDRHVVNCKSPLLVATHEHAVPSASTIGDLRLRLEQPGVWLVCARGNFKQLLGEGWAPHRARESGTFCLGARSSLVAFRRDVFLELGGLAAYEQQIPGQGWAALSLRALLRGYKTVYAGDVDGRVLAPPSFGANPVEGPPLAALLPACDHTRTAAGLLHRHARTAEFRRAFGAAVRTVRLPAARARRTGNLTPLVEPGCAILPGRPAGRAMRLAILAPELPFPAAGGGMNRVHQLARRLAEHCDLFLFCFAASSNESQLEPLLDTYAQVVLVQPGPVSTPPSRFGFETQLAEHAALAMRRHLEVLLDDWRIPVVEVEGTQLAAAGSWLALTSAAKVLAAPELQFALCAEARNSRLLAAAKPAWRQAAGWKRHELGRFDRFDRVVTASGRDRELLEKQKPGVAARVVENGVDFDHFRSTDEAGDESVLFVAPFSEAVNPSAFLALTRDIWPLVRERIPRATLSVVAGADYRLHWRRRFRRSLPATPPEITVLGHVGDLRPLYERAAVVIAPAAGAASQQLLEAFSMSRPAVATADACAALGVESGRHALLAENPADFAAAVVKLLSNASLCRQLGTQARLLVESKFDWQRSAAQQLEIYEELLREKRER